MADLVVERLLSNLGRPGYIHRLPRQAVGYIILGDFAGRWWFQMQSVLDFRPVLFARSSKCCLWFSSKLFSSSSCYHSPSNVGQTSGEIVKWMGEHAPVFGVNGEDISVLHEPNQFFTSLKVRSFSKIKVFAFEYCLLLCFIASCLGKCQQSQAEDHLGFTIPGHWGERATTCKRYSVLIR